MGDSTDSTVAVFSRGEWLDIGFSVRARIVRCDGELDAIEYEHACSEPAMAVSHIAIKPAWKDGWDLISSDPLTLSPSLLCRVCGHHGSIRDGRWVPA